MTSINNESTFELHPQLRADTQTVMSLPLCELLLMNDQRFPWCILVPRLPDLRELHEVPGESKLVLLEEIEQVSRALQQHADAHKMNIAALGNMVPQLHVHVIARQPEDAAWPGPVWGVGSPDPYPAEAAQSLIRALRTRLAQS